MSARSLTFESFGLLLRVEAADPELLAGVPARMPPGSRPRPADGAAACFALMADGGVTLDGATVAGPGLGDPLTGLEEAVRRHVAEHAQAGIFVHAGVVSVDGFGIVIPGSSCSGKSTLVAELVAQGATYYSDEYAVVDSRGLIHPYAQPISLRPRSEPGDQEPPARRLPPGAAWASPPDAMRWLAELRVSTRQQEVPRERTGRAPLPAALIVITRYRGGARWRPRELGAGEGAMALLENTVPARARPAEAIAAARRLSLGARVLGGLRGEARVAARALIRTAGELAA